MSYQLNYKEAKDYIESLSNLTENNYTNDTSEDKSSYLKKIQYFLDLINNPEKEVPHYIHIAGTNGKGSTAHLLSYILKEHNLKTGMMISPHLSSIQERWQINNEPIPKDNFSKIINKLKPKLDEYTKKSVYEPLSFFDITTIIALYYFANKKVDCAIIETGLGGKFDSTNVIPHKDIAAITNIGLDHTHILGDTKEEIAKTKAGIIRENCTAITSEQDKNLQNIIENEAGENNSQFQTVDLDKIGQIEQKSDNTSFKYKNKRYKLNILGKHQTKNAALAIEITKELNIDDGAIKTGLSKAKLPGRMEVVKKAPKIILDSAHNEDKMQTTVDTLKNFEYNNTHLILGFSKNKDWAKMIEVLNTLKPKSVACTRNTINAFRKVANPNKIKEKLADKINTEVFLDPKDSLDWIGQKTKKNDIIMATGSVFLCGELRKHIKNI